MLERSLAKFLIYTCLLFLFTSESTAQIVNIERFRSNVKDTSDGVSGFVGVQLGVIQNNNSIKDIDLSGLFNYVTGPFNFLYIGTLEWLQINGENFLNQGFHHFRYIHLPFKHFGYESFIQYQYNPRIRLRSRVLIGGGATSTMTKEKNSLKGGLGLMWEFNGFESRETRDFRLNSYLSYKHKWDMGSFTLVGYFQPRIDFISDLRSTLDTQLSLDVWRGLKYVTSFSLTYDSRIPEDIEPLVYAWTNGLQWKFN